jgi:hypothetical protein
MKKYMVLLAFVTGCGASDDGNDSAPPQGRPAAVAVAAPSSLAGYYEGGSAAAPNQLCVVEKGGDAQFGIVVWGANLSACSGAGTVERDGDRLRLRMTGDQACTIAARLRGGAITVEGPTAASCSYYCGARVGFEGTSFARKGSTAADIAKARDPAGDPLCSD